MLNLIIFGPPGSGKGTQSVKLAEKYNLTHISTGDSFRSEIRDKTDFGLKWQGVMESGELVSDELLVDLLRSAMNKSKGKDGFLFDGYPRTIQQAHDLDELLGEVNGKVNSVLALDVPDQELMERLLKRAQLEGRKDDTEEVIANRLHVYHDQTKPLMNHYQGQGKLATVNGVGSIETIFESLCDVLD